MPELRVSAVIITKNAERLLATVLDALAWCDEIVVVDSGSTDATVAIARSRGARLLTRAFDGFGSQKQYAVEQATHDWVLAIDADEIVPPALAIEIRETLRTVAAGTSTFAGFEIPRSLLFLGRLMRHGGEFRAPQLRLWDRRRGHYTTALVHEHVVVDGPVGRLQNEMLHDSYAGLEDYFDKFNRYTTAAAGQLHERNERASAITVIGRFPATFLQQYVVRGHILNGYHGFIWALFSAMYPVVKYAKLRELWRRR